MVATVAKIVQVSDDAEVTWYTLPGGTGEFNDNSNQIEDTIFGQTFQSNESGLISFVANANALYKGFAGYVAKILRPGTPIVADGEAMSVESGQIYVVTDDAVKSVWDRSDVIVVQDDAADVTDEVEWVDYLFGRIKFLDSYTVLGTVTVDISYFPMVQLGKGRSFTLTQTANPIDTSDFETVQANGGYATMIPGLRTVALELGGVYDVTSGLRADLQVRTELIIEINPDGAGLSVARGFFRAITEGQPGNAGDLEVETTTFALNVPVETVIDQPAILTPFNWVHDPLTTLTTAIQVILQSWIDQTIIDVQYLYDGTNGNKGPIMVGDVSLTGGLEVMNEFAANFVGDGAPTVVGTG